MSRSSSRRRALLPCFPALLGPLVLAGDPEVPERSVDRSPPAVSRDWLVHTVDARAVVVVGQDDRELALDNGLLRRTFRLAPAAATTGLEDRTSGTSLLRGVKPEARVTLDAVEYDVGGLLGQPEYGYLEAEWLGEMTADATAFQFETFAVGQVRELFGWARVRECEERPWPPPGVALTLRFAAPAGKHFGVRVEVHYELFDGLPLTAKWIEIANDSDRPIRIDSYESDLLAAVEAESEPSTPPRWRRPALHVESDFACGGFSWQSANRAVRWVRDPQYTSQVNYARRTPNLMISGPLSGPGVELDPGERFESHRTFQLLYDSTDRERRGLALRRMYRTLAPWVLENPAMMHVTDASRESVLQAVDQCAETGFDLVILSFGSGFNIELASPEALAKLRELADYAHSKGVQIGGYAVLSSRPIEERHHVIDPHTGLPGGARFGHAPCLGSEWGLAHLDTLREFFEVTGFDALEHDGSYPGDVCASKSHPGHRGLEDSQWKQFVLLRDFYRWCRARGVYLNVPDWYFLNGSNKIGMGYRETNWALPRERQILLARQNVFDGTWEKTPSMGWMFVPLVAYHGGGPDATIEPLSEHLADYDAHLANNFGNGVQAAHRGPRLYDSADTRAVVAGWVAFHERNRDILEGDVVHLRRADGRHLDAMLHVRPGAAVCGLLAVYNPTSKAVSEELRVPLYYTGLEQRARLRPEGQPGRIYELGRDHSIVAPLEVPAGGWLHLLVEEAE